MMETWHPLGVCGVISAFNFPVAVWSWNAALAFVCGDPVVWKPSEKTPLTALATQALVEARDGALRRRAGGPVRGADRRARDRRDPGRRPPRAGRLGDRLDRHGPRRSGRGSRRASPAPSWSSAATTPRSSAPSADLDLALRGVAFAAMGTAGQRCTTLRRLFVHESVYDGFIAAPRPRSMTASRSAIRACPARWSGR